MSGETQKPSIDAFLPCRLIERESGGWLALSARGAPVGIGVEAESREEAERRFKTEAEAWRALLAEVRERSPAAQDPSIRLD